MRRFNQLVEAQRKRNKYFERLIQSVDWRHLEPGEARTFISILVEFSVHDGMRSTVQSICDALYKIHGEKVLHKVDPNETPHRGETVTRLPHKQEKDGSIPSGATNQEVPHAAQEGL